MVCATNQNRHLYVAVAYDTNVDTLGDIGVDTIGDECDKEMFFTYKGPDTVIKSDRIPIKNINYVKALAPADMITPLKEVEVTLAGDLVAGEDYVLRLAFRQFYGMSDQDQYFKDAVVHVTSSMSASDFYKAMVNALNLSFSREVGATKESNPYLSFAVDNNSTATKIIIMEKEQDWTLGTQALERVYFDVVPTTIYDGGDDVVWGTVTDVTSSNTTVGTDAIGNGKKIADLEWFCMGERGDQYRMAGWPNYIPTKYMVDPTAQYYVLEIHFAFTDTGVNSYRSEKDITIVSSTKSVMNSIIGAINSAASLSVETFT